MARGDAVVIGITISGNLRGGVEVERADVTFINCTISGNTALGSPAIVTNALGVVMP